MKLAITTVSYDGYADEASNGERLSVVERAVRKSAELGAHVLVLPGGYFACRTSEARHSIATSLISIARQQKIAVIFGVDQEVKNLSADYRSEIRRGTLPFYVYVWSPTDEGSPYLRNQRSTNRKNQEETLEVRCQDVRILKIEDETIAVLICGEIFNQRIRYALADYQPKPNVVVDVAHMGHRFRVERGMEKLAEQGLSSVCSVHVHRRFAKKRCYVAGKGHSSTSTYDASFFGPPRIELKLWTF